MSPLTALVWLGWFVLVGAALKLLALATSNEVALEAWRFAGACALSCWLFRGAKLLVASGGKL